MTMNKYKQQIRLVCSETIHFYVILPILLQIKTVYININECLTSKTAYL